MTGIIVESLDVEGFGDHFQIVHLPDVTRVAFQNYGPQPQYQTNKKAQDVAMVMIMAMAGRYLDVLLVAEHGLYPPALKSKHG